MSTFSIADEAVVSSDETDHDADARSVSSARNDGASTMGEGSLRAGKRRLDLTRHIKQITTCPPQRAAIYTFKPYISIVFVFLEVYTSRKLTKHLKRKTSTKPSRN